MGVRGSVPIANKGLQLKALQAHGNKPWSRFDTDHLQLARTRMHGEESTLGSVNVSDIKGELR
jgi:hypothetical protein